MALHPPSHKQTSIIPLPLPFSSTQFSFQTNTLLDPATELPDHIGSRLSDGYIMQKTAQNQANFTNWSSVEGRFGAETYRVEDESGVSTPRLWRTSPSRSPPHGQNIDYRCLSPSSKAQAIARGQRELMEMISRMPESCYELSLKDLVEHQPVVVEPKHENSAEGRGVINEDSYKKEKGKKKRKNPKPQISRSGSIDNGGFLLKMVFPISLGSKKKKKNDSNASRNSKVSPKPTVPDASGKSVDKEWWKRSGSTTDSGSTKSSSSSCKSIGNSSRWLSCLAFILTRKSKTSQ